jgi:1-acyl-sn-glycerol-3-phosphate acyltransferase
VGRGKEHPGFWFGLAVVVLKPLLMTFTRRDWRGREHIPAAGAAIIAANHISHIDPLTFAHFVYDNGRVPRFLVKQELFGVPFVGRLLRGAGQVPVQRRTRDAAQAVQAGVDALAAGKCVAIYPEGTISRDPQLWPMLPRTGVARLALTAGVPVIPVGQWGAQQVLWPYTKRPHLIPPRTVHYAAGPPVDLSAYAGKELTVEVLRAATDDIMRAVRAQVAQLRGETAPEEFFDPRGADDHGERRSA